MSVIEIDEKELIDSDYEYYEETAYQPESFYEIYGYERYPVEDIDRVMYFELEETDARILGEEGVSELTTKIQDLINDYLEAHL